MSIIKKIKVENKKNRQRKNIEKLELKKNIFYKFFVKKMEIFCVTPAKKFEPVSGFAEIPGDCDGLVKLTVDVVDEADRTPAEKSFWLGEYDFGRFADVAVDGWNYVCVVDAVAKSGKSYGKKLFSQSKEALEKKIERQQAFNDGADAGVVDPDPSDYGIDNDTPF